MKGKNQKMAVMAISDILMKDTASKIFNRNGTTADNNDPESNFLTNMK